MLEMQRYFIGGDKMSESRYGDTRPTLVLTVGLPRSGKTTWATDQGFPIVCPDEIRKALHGHAYAQEAETFVWAIAQVMVRSLFASRHKTVILDATNTTRRRRSEWMNDGWHTVAVVIKTDIDECHRRATKTLRHELGPVINRMADQLEPISPDEGIEVWDE